MKLSVRAVKALGKVVTGDGGLSPYRSGPQLVDLFVEYGANDYYGDGFPSRWKYAEDEIRKLNDTPELAALIKEVLDPREYISTDFNQQDVCGFLNAYIKFDGYELALVDGIPQIRDLEGSTVECRHPHEGSAEDGHVFIDQQLAKSDEKIQAGDYDGAITNARSLVEAVLTDLERDLTGVSTSYDGDLLKLYKRVQGLLHLDPGRPDIEGPLKQVLTGLASIISGMAGISNKMGDRHVRTYKPDKRHAVLVVNAAKTVVNFLYETRSAQDSQSSG